MERTHDLAWYGFLSRSGKNEIRITKQDDFATMFMTYVDRLYEYDNKSLVIMLGQCQIDEGLKISRLLQFPDAGPESAKSIAGIDVREFGDGVFFLVSSDLAQNHFSEVRLIQKLLLFTYTKFVWFPALDTSTPDPLGIGGDKGPLANLVYEINKFENLPYLMGRPRAKGLEGALPATPVLLLAPGPSLAVLAPYIKELSERYLIVCLSRTLAFCREHGVTPDIVVQLDTHGEQQNFYLDDIDLSQSWLFALSCAPARKYLHRFGGVTWLDSFEPRSYGDAYQLRNSWLSSLISMLGVAELFRPPKLLIAGADLAYVSSRYFDGKEGISQACDQLSKADIIDAVKWLPFPVCLNDGTIGETTPQYFAVAFEAETVASELLSAGTLVYSLTRSGILDENLFPYESPEAFLDGPPLNRQKLFKIMDLSTRTGQVPDEKWVKALLQDRLKTADILLGDIEKLAATTTPESVQDHPLLSAGKLLSHLHPMSAPEDIVYLSRQMIHRYRTVLHERALYFRLKDWAAMGKPVPVYCYPDEQDHLALVLGESFPNGKWEFRSTWGEGASSESLFKISGLPKALGEVPMSLMSRRYVKGADYLLPFIKAENYLVVEDVTGAAWPKPVQP